MCILKLKRRRPRFPLHEKVCRPRFDVGYYRCLIASLPNECITSLSECICLKRGERLYTQVELPQASTRFKVVFSQSNSWNLYFIQ